MYICKTVIMGSSPILVSKNIENRNNYEIISI
nr:MAG TPA: hypothetical protein [Caudoviricetes sp.]